MTTKGKKLQATLDGKGSLEIAGLSRGDTQMRELGGLLGIEGFAPANFLYTVIRADGLDAAAIARVRAKAAELGWDLQDVENLAEIKKPTLKNIPEHVSTVEALHQHTLAPSRREKMVLPIVLVAAVIVIGYIGSVVWDHMSHAYRPVAGLDKIPAIAAQAGKTQQGGLAGLLNPSDSQYASVEITSWQQWLGKNALVQNVYIRMGRIRENSIEELVKGERGSARVVLNFDLSKSTPPTYYLDGISRAGIATDDKNLEVEIYPVKITDLPTDFHVGPEIDPRNPRSYSGLTKFAVTGYLEPVGDGLRFRSDEGYRITLDPITDPGLREVVRDLTLTPADIQVLDEKKLVRGRPDIDAAKRLDAYLILDEALTPDTRSSDPVQAETVARAKVAGFELGKWYIAE